MSLLDLIMQKRASEQAAPLDVQSNGHMLDTEGGSVLASILNGNRAMASNALLFGEVQPQGGTNFGKYMNQLNPNDETIRVATGVDQMMAAKTAHDMEERDVQIKYANAGYFRELCPPIEVIDAMEHLSSIKAASMVQAAVAQGLNTGEIAANDPEIVPILAQAFLQ